MFNLRKIKVLFEFYKSTLLYSISIFILFLIFSKPFIAFFWGSIIGLLLVLFLKETNKNNDYLFYFNCGLTKVQLFGFSLILNLIITLIILIFLK